MRTIHAVAVMAIFTSSFAVAMGQMASDDVKQNLMRMEQEDTQAFIKGDTAVIDRDVADSMAFTAPDGSTSTKADTISSIKSGDLKFESSVLSDFKVMQYGDTAVVTYTSTDKGSYKGQDISGTFRWTDVWVKHGGKWQCVASQGTPVMAMMKKP
jgi:ketosteroid isomerase-like protein